MQTSKKENCAVDVMKYVMAVFVIIIHKPIFDSSFEFKNYFIQNIMASVAVPFFFIASSYFFFSKICSDNKESNKTLFKFEKRLFILYALWSIIYLPCIFVKYNSGQYDLLQPKIILGQAFLTIKNFFLSQSFVHFWYITTLMLSVGIVYLLYKRLNHKQILLICLVFFSCSRFLLYLNSKGYIAGQMYSSFVPEVLRNSLEKGCLNIALGLFISKSKLNLKRSSAFGFAIIAYLCMTICGVLIYKKDNELYKAAFYMLVLLVASSILFLCLNTNIKEKKIYIYLRKSSTLIYFSHLLMMSNVFKFISNISGFAFISESNVFMLVVTFIFANTFSALIIYFSKKEKLRFLKYLY